MTKEEILELIRAEYEYWLASGDECGMDISIGAVGALANVYAAVRMDEPGLVYGKIKERECRERANRSDDHPGG